MLSIAAGDNTPKTVGKYTATVTPQGKDMWSIVIEDVRAFAVDPETVYSRSTAFQQDKFAGTEEEARTLAMEQVKNLMAERDAMSTAKPFTITEDDCV